MPPRKGADAAGARIVALYQQPSASFVTARNALASALKKEGDAETAERVKRLAKPSPGAWALNQVYWRERPLFERMIRAGDALRALQQQMLAGRSASSRDATAERKAAVDTVVERGLAFLRGDGNVVTGATRQRLATSADALASYGSAAEGFTPGQMVEDLEAPGFAALASLGGALRLVHGARPAGQPGAPSRGEPASAPGPAGARPRGGDRKAERRADKEREAAARREAGERAKAVRAAEQALRDATRELESVRQRAARARATAETLAQEQRTLDEQLARVVTRRRAADAAAVEASEAVASAERIRRDAEAALTAIRDGSPSRR